RAVGEVHVRLKVGGEVLRSLGRAAHLVAVDGRAASDLDERPHCVGIDGRRCGTVGNGERQPQGAAQLHKILYHRLTSSRDWLHPRGGGSKMSARKKLNR